jgi:uncharacterized RDD family membrane protein YckC
MNTDATHPSRNVPFGTALLAAGIDLVWVPAIAMVIFFLLTLAHAMTGHEVILLAVAVLVAMATLPGQRLLGIGLLAHDGKAVSRGRRALRQLLRLAGMAAGCGVAFLVWGVATLGFPEHPKLLLVLGSLTIPVVLTNGFLAARRRPLLHDLLCRTRPVLFRADPRWGEDHVQIAARALALWIDLGLLSLCAMPWKASWPSLLVLALAAVLLHRALPGRWLAGIRIVDGKGHGLSYGRGAVREALRLLTGTLQTWVLWKGAASCLTPARLLERIGYPAAHPVFWSTHHVALAMAVVGTGILLADLVQSLRGKPLFHDLIMGTRPQWRQRPPAG